MHAAKKQVFAIGLNKLETFLRKQRPELKIPMVHLRCDLPENQVCDHERAPEDRMNDRVAVVRKKLENEHWPPRLRTIDTTHLALAGVVAVIDGGKIRIWENVQCSI